MKTNPHRIVLFIAGLITVFLGVMIYTHPPAFYPDPSHGFQVMRCMQLGGPFNVFSAPDQDDISKNTFLYLTWWSPGQYLIPYSIQSLFGINTGHATALTIMLFELSGLAGLYCFFRKIGFTAVISAFSMAFIICQQAFVLPFVFYNGGEVLLFGFEGWFLYGLLTIEKPGIKMLVFVLLSGWIGFLCKSSFMWMFAAGLLCLWLRLSAISGKLNMNRLIKNGIWLAIPAVLSLAAIYVFFLSKGANPTSASGGFIMSWQSFTFPMGSPLIAGFSVDDLAHGLLYHPMGSLLTPGHALMVIFLSAIVSLVLMGAIMRYVPKNDYRLIVIVFYAMSVLFFSAVFLRGMNVSYEGRHFRIIGLLIIPGVIYLVSGLKPLLKALFVVLCVGIAFVNYSFLVKGYRFNKNVSARGVSGMAQECIDQHALNYLMQLDRQNHRAVFAFISTDLGLEIVQNRVIALDAPPTGEPFSYDDYSYDGHSGPLYLLLPASYNGAKAAMFMKFFPGYSNFTVQKLSPGYTLYSAK